MNSVEGKGIEMIRTDQCEYIRQLSEDFLTRVFTSSSLSQVQTYESFCIDIFRFVQNEFRKILTSQIPIPDFILWREVKLGSYKMKSSNATDQDVFEGDLDFHKIIALNPSLPPAAVISIKRILNDERDVPLYKEKVPYLVIYGEPGVAVRKGVKNRVD